MIKNMMKTALDRFGIYAKWRRNLPRCADWLVDVERCLGGRAPGVVLDVGANVGQTTLEIRRRHPLARIHAFEPVQSTFDILKANVGALPGVQCHRLALSDREGEQTIRAIPGSVFNSLDSKLLAEEKNAAQEGIILGTVDRFLAGQGLRSVDLLKTDTEGHDLKVLEGAKDVLSRGGVGCVYTEVTFSQENSHNTQFGPVFDFLRGAGYRFMGLYEMEYFQTNPWSLSFCNALFARTEPRPTAGADK